jgi:hypothetical protein
MSRTAKTLTWVSLLACAAALGGIAVLIVSVGGPHALSEGAFGITLGAALIAGLALTVICALG